MHRNVLSAILTVLCLSGHSQLSKVSSLIESSEMKHGSLSVCFIDADSGKPVFEYNSSKSFSQASVMKLVTTAAALELLGPDYRFKTILGYSGVIDKKSGDLRGNVVILGGGDPSLGSEYFSDHYGSVTERWTDVIIREGIRTIRGRVITDDSYFDYQPVPPGWNWEDMGNYYGAGVYGLTIYDNLYRIHFKTSAEGTRPEITATDPVIPGLILDNNLVAHGSSDQGYVFLSPYNYYGWISGSIPPERQDFVLKASIPDPPMLAAENMDDRLKSFGLKIRQKPSTVRISGTRTSNLHPLDTIFSPPLSEIIKTINHESINLFSEHLVKEIGRVYGDTGTYKTGIEVIAGFLDTLGVETDGMFIEDGSGLSPQNALNSSGIARLLYLMKKKGKHFNTYYESIPEAGSEGTLKKYFTDPVFSSAMRAKSGTILRVKSYAGYLTCKSGRTLTFSIIVNNFTGTSSKIITDIEEILKEVILYK